MINRIKLTVVFFSLTVLIAGCGIGSSGNPSAIVKLGFVNPTSGQFAPIGKSMRRGLEMYLSEHGNRLGGRKVELVEVDEGAGAASAVPGARKLIQRDRVNAVTGVVSSATAAALFPQFEQAKIPVVLTQGYPYPNVRRNPSPYLWCVGVTTAPIVEATVGHLASNVPADKGVYFLSADYVQGHTMIERIKKSYAKAGGRVAGSDFAPLGSTLDYQPYLSKIARSGAAAVYAFFSGADGVRFVKQYKSFGLAERLPVYSSSSLTVGSSMQEQGDAAKGIVTVGIYEPSVENPENKRFVAEYQKRYHAVPDTFAAQQYDAMAALDGAIGSVRGELTSDAIIDGLRGIATLETPRGRWQFEKDAQFAMSTMYLFEVRKTDGRLSSELIRDIGVFNPASGKKVG